MQTGDAAVMSWKTGVLYIGFSDAARSGSIEGERKSLFIECVSGDVVVNLLFLGNGFSSIVKCDI